MPTIEYMKFKIIGCTSRVEGTIYILYWTKTATTRNKSSVVGRWSRARAAAGGRVAKPPWTSVNVAPETRAGAPERRRDATPTSTPMALWGLGIEDRIGSRDVING